MDAKKAYVVIARMEFDSNVFKVMSVHLSHGAAVKEAAHLRLVAAKNRALLNLFGVEEVPLKA